MTPKEIAEEYVSLLQIKLPDANIFWESVSMISTQPCKLIITSKSDDKKKFEYTTPLTRIPTQDEIDRIVSRVRMVF
jgi:hypothetical protein